MKQFDKDLEDFRNILTELNKNLEFTASEVNIKFGKYAGDTVSLLLFEAAIKQENKNMSQRVKNLLLILLNSL